MPYSPSSKHHDRIFFAVVMCTGCAIVAHSATNLLSTPLSADQRVGCLLLGALTLLTGSFTIKIPRLSIRISVSDAFVFASVLQYGTSVATLIVAVDSVVATCWMRRENRSLFRSIFNLSAASVSIWTASEAFYLFAPPAGSGAFALTGQLAPLFLLAATYFLLNSWIIAAALAFEQQTSVVRLWVRHFPWFSLNYFGGVSAAALLVSHTTNFDYRAVSIILPILAISYLTYRTSLGRVQDAERHLDQMNQLYMSTIEALAMAVDAKDQITHGHIRRVQTYAVELARRLGVEDRGELSAIETAALLHDMGKLAIPEHILNKPGALTPTEFEKMKRHAEIGAELLSSIKFPYPVVPIVRHHHEHWDGGGYPAGIAGADIPLGARILSVVDCYDALTSDRPYRPRLTDSEAFEIIRQRRGTMYDPLVVDTFVRVHPEIAPLARRAGQEARTVLLETDTTEYHRQEVPFTQIRSTAFESSLLTNLQQRLSVSSTTQSMLSEAAGVLRQITPARTFALYRYDATSDQLVCVSTVGDPDSMILGSEISIGEKVTGWSAANQGITLNANPHLDIGAAADMFDPPLRSMISVPIVKNSAVYAVLSAYATKRDAYTDVHKYVFERVAELIGERIVAKQLPTEALHLKSVVAFRTAT